MKKSALVILQIVFSVLTMLLALPIFFGKDTFMPYMELSMACVLISQSIMHWNKNRKISYIFSYYYCYLAPLYLYIPFYSLFRIYSPKNKI